MTNNRFNKGKLGKEFPITQHRWTTTNHPIFKNANCRSKLETRFTGNEKQTLEALCRYFQCELRDALRICLYEAARTPVEALAEHLTTARLDTTERGHSNASHKLAIRLPTVEKKAILAVADEMGVSEKVIIRLAFIWMSRGIRDQSITKLKGCTKWSQKKCKDAWKETVEQGAPSKLEALRHSHQKAYDTARELGVKYDALIYEERGHAMRTMVDLGIPINVQGKFSLELVDTFIQMEEVKFFQRLIDEDKTDRSPLQVVQDYYEGKHDDVDLAALLAQSVIDTLSNISTEDPSPIVIDDSYLPSADQCEAAKQDYMSRKKEPENETPKELNAYLKWVENLDKKA